jgi:hypothetical protein
MTFFEFLGGILLIGLFFLPTIWAYKTKHPQRSSIFFINFFLGWTLIGWIIAALWANSQSSDKK